jgi:hypothetical protein
LEKLNHVDVKKPNPIGNTHFGRIDTDFAKKAVFTSVLIEEPPVHLVVPPEFVGGSAQPNQEPNVEEWILPVLVTVLLGETVSKNQSDCVHEECKVFESIGQVGKLVLGVHVAPHALGKSDPRRHAHHHHHHDVVDVREVSVVTRHALLL